MENLIERLQKRIIELEQDFVDLEKAYWEFDAMRKGYGVYKGHPQAERDAYKMSVRSMIKETFKRTGI